MFDIDKYDQEFSEPEFPVSHVFLQFYFILFCLQLVYHSWLVGGCS